MQGLPRDVIGEILGHLHLKEVLNKASLNKHCASICRADVFWTRYALKHYFITDIKKGLLAEKTPKEVCMMAQRLLDRMFKRQLYPSYRLLNITLPLLLEKDIDVENWSEQNLLSSTAFLSHATKYLSFPDLDSFRLPPGDTGGDYDRMKVQMHANMNSTGSEMFAQILERALVPCLYLTPKGPLSLPIDVDRREYMSEVGLKDLGDDDDEADIFMEYIDENFHIHMRIIFFRHVIPFLRERAQ